jgi:hypothetical protein
LDARLPATSRSSKEAGWWEGPTSPAAGHLHPPARVRHLLAAYDLSRDRLYGHTKPRKRRGEFLVFLRYLRTLYPPGVQLGIVLDNFSPHLSTRTDRRVAD